MEQSKYGQYKRRRVPRHRKSQRLEGAFEDKGNWIRCWYCGQIVNLEKETGDPQRDGNYQVEAVIPSGNPVCSGDVFNGMSTMDSPFELGVSMELGPDGVTPREIYSTKIALVSSGCPHCGCTYLP